MKICTIPNCAYLSETSRMIALYKEMKSFFLKRRILPELSQDLQYPALSRQELQTSPIL
jgi:hypothetical protein